MNNYVPISVGLSICLLTCLLLEAQTPTAKETEELERVKKTYQQKRADALKPVNTWYETQLESLRKKLTQKGDLDGALHVRNELEAMKDGSLHENDDDFKKALLGTSWSWSESPNEKGVQMTFKDDPTVSHIGMHGNWRITGPREVTIIESSGAKHILRFDQKITGYQSVNGNGGGSLYGRRWQ